MKRRKIYNAKIQGRNGRLCISEEMMQKIILDVLKDQDDYFVDSVYICDAINDFYGEDTVSLAKVRHTLNRIVRENLVIMKHSIRSPSHTKYYSHPDNHENKR